MGIKNPDKYRQKSAKSLTLAEKKRNLIVDATMVAIKAVTPDNASTQTVKLKRFIKNNKKVSWSLAKNRIFCRDILKLNIKGKSDAMLAVYIKKVQVQLGLSGKHVDGKAGPNTLKKLAKLYVESIKKRSKKSEVKSEVKVDIPDFE